MAKKVIVFSQFNGGLSDDSKIGIKYSAAYLQGFDVRSSPSQMSVLPGMTREDGGVVRDLILNEVMASNGIIYGVGNSGVIYRRSVNGMWSVIDSMSSGTGGIDFRKDTDAIYLTSNKTATRIDTIVNGTSPILNVDYFSDSISTYNNINQVGFVVAADQEGSQLTTAILVATSPLNESDLNRRYFQTDIEPCDRISVYVIAKGTGDWTLTLQDGINNILATSTILNANLKNNAWADFYFTNAPNGQVRLYPAPNARTYHFHVTSTVADGMVSSSTSNDLHTCDVRVWADRFVYPVSGLHVIDRFLQYELFGNGNYISAWEPISDPPTNDEWKRHRLTVPMEYDNVGIDHTNEFSIAAWGMTTTSTISNPAQGLLTFWDGLADTYNYDVPIAEGTPWALHVYMNVAYYYAGGSWWAITSPTTQPVKLKTLPHATGRYSTTSTPTTMYPYGATVQDGIQLLAFPGKTTNPNINVGVYSWGALNKNYDPTLSYDYLSSTGTQNYATSNNIQLGMVKAFGDLIHLSWRDDQGSGSPKYGIDVVTNASLPVGYAKYQSLVISNGYEAKEKTAAYVEAYFPNLPAGVTITLGYSIDEGAFVVDKNSYSTTNLWQGKASYARFDVTLDVGGMAAGRFHEIQGQIEIRTGTGIVNPASIQMVAVVIDDGREEQL